EQEWAKLLARHTADFIDCRRVYQVLQHSSVRDRETRIRAEAANTAKDRFLGMLSHELRQPLSAALSAVGVQKHSPSTERRAHAADIIEQQLRQMVRLVDDIRDATHMSHGTMVLRRERVDLRAVVGKAIEMMNGRFNAKRQTVDVELCAEPAWVSADDA